MDQETASTKDMDITPPETAPAEQQPDKTYEIDIFRDWCKSCGICAGFCPRKCIILDADGNPMIADPKRCTGCRWCELHCPDFAICVKELAAQQTAEEAD